MSKLYILLSLFVICTCSAQEVLPEFKLDEIIISATRFKNHSSDIPFSITTLDTTLIRLQNPQTAADMLSATGKVFIQKSQQGGGSPMIRSFATNRLLYTVDGVRMNTAIYRSGNIQNVISLDPYAMERAEVLFGAAPVMYGSDAIGGVMAFTTLSPKTSTNDSMCINGHSDVRYSSANSENTEHFDVNIGWKNFASLTSISHNDFGDLRMGNYGPGEYLRSNYVQRIDGKDVAVTNANPLLQTPTGYTQTNIMQKFLYSYTLEAGTEINLLYNFHYSETSNYARYDRLVRNKNNTPQYGEWYYGPQKWQMHSLEINVTDFSLIADKYSMILAYQNFGESRNDRTFNKNDLHRRTENVDAYSLNADFEKNINNTTRINYGLDIVNNDVVSTGADINILDNSSVKSSSRYPQSAYSSVAVYCSFLQKINKFLSMTTGLRYTIDSLDATFDTLFYKLPFTQATIENGVFTSNFGFAFNPNLDWKIFSNISTAFRSPNVDDMGKVFDSEVGSVTIPNPALKAEYACNANIGIGKLFGNWMKVELDGYYTYLKDAFVRRNFTLNGQDSIMYDGVLSQVKAMQNAANAAVYGFSLNLETKLPLGFSFSTNLNYQHGEEELDNGTKSPSRHAAPFYGASALKYIADKFNLQLYTNYCAEVSYDNMPEEEKGKPEIYAVDNDENPYSPAWYTLNLKTSYNLTDAITIYTGIENITDVRYRPYSSGIVSAGRNFVMSLNLNF